MLQIRRAIPFPLVLIFIAAGALGQAPKSGPRPTPASQPAAISPSSDDGDQLVKIEKLQVTGSRLEASSVQMLTGLRIGQQINEAILRKAIQRMTDSGLVKSVNYSYESASSPTSVLLELTIADEAPLLPATIQLPGVEAENVWAYLKGIDPLFSRELPRTQKALAFYVRYIERYLFTLKRQDKVVTVITASDNGEASGIVFVPASLLGLPQFNNKKKQ
ncbi:MAG: hypothetical protein ABL995_02640 [Bryobacteraceae bacterium]